MTARVGELRRLLRGYDAQYYLEDDSEIPDAEYDALKDELRALEERHPELVEADSPTQTVGIAPAALFAPVVHRTPMMSLDKVTTLEEILAWGARLQKMLVPENGSPFVCEPKIDGLSISLTYERGRLVRGATRGDGRVGEDVTPNVRTVATIPGELALGPGEIPEIVEVRGEVYFPVPAFEELNRRQASRWSAPFFQSPQRCRRLAAPEGREGHRRACARGLLLPGGRRRRDSDAVRLARCPPSSGAPGQSRDVCRLGPRGGTSRTAGIWRHADTVLATRSTASS